jgi:hypothetical protein
MPTPLLAVGLPLDASTQQIVEALRQMAQQLPMEKEFDIPSTTVTATSWTSIDSWVLGSALTERQLTIEAWLKVTADDAGGEEIHPLELRLLLDSTALDSDWRFALPDASLLRPAPTPLSEFFLVFSPPIQTIGRGTHTLELQAQTGSGGSWTFSSTSRIRYSMR